MRKMLKHDLNAIWPVWRIVAPSVLLLSALAGAVAGLGYAEFEFLKDINWMFMISAYIIDSYWPMILSAFTMLITILVVVRYYKNFFTDEGYLTFTLPVSRTSLLNSKILMALIWMAATAVVCILASVTYSFVLELVMPDDGFRFGNISAELIKELLRSVFDTEAGVHLTLFGLEIVFIVLASAVANILLLLMCITIGAVIVKKAKLLLGLGIYYGANAVVVGFIYVGIIVGVIAIAAVSEVSEDAILPMLHIMFSLGGVLFSGVAVGAYLFNKKLINEKLNLP